MSTALLALEMTVVEVFAFVWLLIFWCQRHGMLGEARRWRTIGLATGGAAVALGLST